MTNESKLRDRQLSDVPTYRQEVDIHPDIDDGKLLRKLDWHILPPLSLLYLLCYLDRT